MMLKNASSRSLSPSGYYDAKLRRRQLYRAAKKAGTRKHATFKFKEQYFPFHRLPREIIAEIFVLCLPRFEDVFGSFKTKSAAPLLLCNVSSSWRCLALSIPNLWNEFSVRITNPQVDIDLAISMAETWIGRSGELPLSLRLYASTWKREQAEVMVEAHLNTLFRHASRWRSVDITFFDCSAVSFPKFGPTPLLRKFSYSTLCSSSVPFPFTSCPLMSSFSWPFLCFIGSNRDPNIPWHQLTHMTLEHTMSTHQTLHILRACKTLVELNVKIDEDLGLDRIRPRRKLVEHRSLRSFYICMYQTCSDLLQGLTLPALTDFSLDTDYDSLSYISPRSVHTQLLRLFTRSKCKLEKLKLGDCGFNDACILKCLKHDSCSSLTELEIANVFHRPMFTDSVVLALTDEGGLSETDNVLLPNLSRLSLEMCLSASPGALGFMIATRCLWWDEEDQLKSLSLIVRDPLEDIDSTFLQLAESVGLDIDITIEECSDSEFTADFYDTDDS